MHDAVLLDAMGAYGIAHGLADAYRERLDILEMADAIEAAAGAPLRTEAGRASRRTAARASCCAFAAAAARRARGVSPAPRSENGPGFPGPSDCRIDGQPARGRRGRARTSSSGRPPSARGSPGWRGSRKSAPGAVRPRSLR